MKKAIFPLLLVLASMLSISVFATNTDNLSQRSLTYENNFSDLSQDNVFYDNVVALYEYALSVGKADGTFDLESSLTMGEVLVFTARMRSLATTGDAEAAMAPYVTDGQSAYDPYVAYLLDNEVVEDTFAQNLTTPATRAQVAHALANALPTGTLTAINGEVVTQGYALGQFIPDVDEYTPYYWDILSLYYWGITAGYDDVGTFDPLSPVSRGAAAAMLTRMVDASLRITLDWTIITAKSAQGTTYGDLVTPGLLLSAPMTWDEMDESVRYMLSNEENQLRLRYESLSLTQARTWMELALAVTKSYCEQGYNAVTCEYDANGTMTLTFDITVENGDVMGYRDQALEAAIAIHDGFWDDGTLTDTMTQKEIAAVYYQWICEHTTYDLQSNDTSLSHLHYSLFTEGVAVCDGYTGAYNLLLKLEGIECTALSNSSHIWTVAELDGVSYHIDTTWGDGGSSANWNYFAMTESQSQAIHPW